jgi:hypothetical protein
MFSKILVFNKSNFELYHAKLIYTYNLYKIKNTETN